ncbi:MAG: type II toxin-antitoxin system PemK/MazF family toxin [Desulfonatronovibrio sp.]
MNGQRALANTNPKAGEIWYADLGMISKSRPVLVLYSPHSDDARNLLIVAPLTSQIRSMRGEVPLGQVSWLPKLSAVNLQGVASLHPKWLVRKIGVCTSKTNA